MAAPKRREKTDVVDEAVLLLMHKFGSSHSALTHVVGMFSTVEIDILIGQLKAMPDDLSYPLDI